VKREILINGSQRETRVAILEDDRLVELLVDRADHRRTVGDIYKGRVEAVLPGIQAAFVDIGLEKSAFLHASDLLEPDEDEEDSDENEDAFDTPEPGLAIEQPEEVVAAEDTGGNGGSAGMAGTAAVAASVVVAGPEIPTVAPPPSRASAKCTLAVPSPTSRMF
jgi:Ribonucleases G and E